MKTKPIKKYSVIFMLYLSAVLFTMLLEDVLYIEIFNKIAYGICISTMIYSIAQDREKQKVKWDKVIIRQVN